MKIIVLDDDPTGSQTVYGCPLLLDWSVQNLSKALTNQSNLIFILINTRSMNEELATKTISDVCESLIKALTIQKLSLNDVFVISRGDSTLRGHGVLEPTLINKLLGPFDATFHIRAFLEAGRSTKDGIHLLDGEPVHLSSFARDPVFGFSTSCLDQWIEEKSNGRILAENVIRLNLDLLNQAIHSETGKSHLINLLLALKHNQTVIVDSIESCHLNILADSIKEITHTKKFLFRTAASFINALASLPKQKYDIDLLANLRRRSINNKPMPGIVVVGSYVDLAQKQLENLLSNDNCLGVELNAYKILEVYQGHISKNNYIKLQDQIIDSLNQIIASNKTPVLFTSRNEIKFELIQDRIEFGNLIATFMANLFARISYQYGYLISKGGITTQYILSEGLHLNSVELIGQLLPGLSLVLSKINFQTEPLPIITFPGNLGDEKTLLKAWKIMESTN